MNLDHLVFVLTVPVSMKQQAVDAFVETWKEKTWKGENPPRLAIVREGMTLQAIHMAEPNPKLVWSANRSESEQKTETEK